MNYTIKSKYKNNKESLYQLEIERNIKYFQTLRKGSVDFLINDFVLLFYFLVIGIEIFWVNALKRARFKGVNFRPDLIAKISDGKIVAFWIVYEGGGGGLVRRITQVPKERVLDCFFYRNSFVGVNFQHFLDQVYRLKTTSIEKRASKGAYLVGETCVYDSQILLLYFCEATNAFLYIFAFYFVNKLIARRPTQVNYLI